jgi:hypothetical protein
MSRFTTSSRHALPALPFLTGGLVLLLLRLART